MPTSSSSSHVVTILSVPTDKLLLVRFRGPIFGIGTHYRGENSVPCMGDKFCRPAVHRDPLQYKGYASVDQWCQTEKTWAAMVFEVTAACEEVLRTQLEPGQLWAFERQIRLDRKVHSKQRNGKVVSHFVEQTGILLPAFSVFPVLRRLWMLDTDPPPMTNNIAPATVIPTVSEHAPDLAAILARIGKEPLAPPKRETALDIPAIVERMKSSLENGRINSL